MAPPIATAPPIAVGACSHPDTVATVKSLFVSNAGGGMLMSDPESIIAAKQALQDGTAPLSLEGIRTVSLDQATGRSVCNAQMRIGVVPGTFERLASNPIFAIAIGSAGWSRDGETLSAISTVAYTSQLTDDKSDVYIQLEAPRELIQGAALLAVASSVAKSDGLPAAAPAAPTKSSATSSAASEDGC
jgi:hypothetical protein